MYELFYIKKNNMLYEVDWAEDGTYRPGEYNSPEKLFNDCLENSNEFDLKLGYFSSAAISVLADGFASFISNGGRMRMIINHIVSDEDKEAISKGIHGEWSRSLGVRFLLKDSKAKDRLRGGKRTEESLMGWATDGLILPIESMRTIESRMKTRHF